MSNEKTGLAPARALVAHMKSKHEVIHHEQREIEAIIATKGEQIVLTEKEFTQFQDVLDRPAKVKPRLKRLLSEPAVLKRR
jgi:uncharacterized protein (DUF1778 family)